MNKLRLAASSVISTFVFLTAATASADVAPPNTFGCSDGRADAGASCVTDDSFPGTCAPSTCTERVANTADGGDGGFNVDTYNCSICVASTDSCGDQLGPCNNLALGNSCTLTGADAASSFGTCATISCSGANVLSCVATTNASDAAAPTNGTTCAPHAAECAGHKLGDGCATSDGVSGNCGQVACDGQIVLSCMEGKGASAGGCMFGGASDLASGFVVLGLLAPFAAFRRKRSRRTERAAA